MRIGRTIIDIESLNLEDLKAIEHEIHALRRRREQAENFKTRMNNLLYEAREAGFDFIDKDFGNVITANDIEMYDNQ